MCDEIYGAAHPTTKRAKQSLRQALAYDVTADSGVILTARGGTLHEAASAHGRGRGTEEGGGEQQQQLQEQQGVKQWRDIAWLNRFVSGNKM